MKKLISGTLRLDVVTSFLDEQLLRLDDPVCAGDRDCQAKKAHDHWIAQGKSTGDTIRITGKRIPGTTEILMESDLDAQP